MASSDCLDVRNERATVYDQSRVASDPNLVAFQFAGSDLPHQETNSVSIVCADYEPALLRGFAVGLQWHPTNFVGVMLRCCAGESEILLDAVCPLFVYVVRPD